MLTTVKTGPLITVHNPVGYPPTISRKQPAPRPSSLDGKTVYLVDTKFDDSLELLRQVQAWFEAKMPGVKTVLRQMASYYGKDDPVLWDEIRTQGHAAVIGVGHCSTCAPAVTTHAITLETRYGVPTVALHTDKFVKVVQTVGRMGGLQQLPQVPVLLHFGEHDTHIPQEHVRQIAAACPQAELHVYPAGHGFNCDARAAFHTASAELAASRTERFLRNALTC